MVPIDAVSSTGNDHHDTTINTIRSRIGFGNAPTTTVNQSNNVHHVHHHIHRFQNVPSTDTFHQTTNTGGTLQLQSTGIASYDYYANRLTSRCVNYYQTPGIRHFEAFCNSTMPSSVLRYLRVDLLVWVNCEYFWHNLCVAHGFQRRIEHVSWKNCAMSAIIIH